MHDAVIVRNLYLELNISVSSTMRTAILLLVTILTISSPLVAQPKTDTLLHNMLLRSSSELLKSIISRPDTFRLQIIS